MYLSQVSSHVAVAIDRYSASVMDDLDTVVCFFVFQQIRESPRKIQKHVVDLFVMRQFAQFASQYAFNSKELFAKSTPSLGLFFRNMATRRASIQVRFS